MSDLFTGFREPLRWRAAQRLRRLAGAIWDRWDLGGVRYFSTHDAAMVRVVNAIDATANRLDPPW